MASGRPNWWVILAVSLALMALLVATATSAPAPLGPHRAADALTGHLHRSTPSVTSHHPATRPSSSTTTTTSIPASPATSGLSGTALVSARGASSTPTTLPPVVTTTTVPPTTTTTQPPTLPADRTQTEGDLDPPVQTSNAFAFTGTGAMQISVVWSGSTYLSMTVSCANGSQTVGGTSAMEASLPDATGSCEATVTEPSSESTALTYTITIGPADE
jgi:hypothetical protein